MKIENVKDLTDKELLDIYKTLLEYRSFLLGELDKLIEVKNEK